MSAADEENMRRYERATHAMQSGVATEMGLRPEPTTPKHLRVGVNSAMVDSSALAKLLIDKGVIAESDYLAAIADGMESEVERYEKHLSDLTGVKITLG